jgi:general secretion pathway protein C
MEALFRKYFWLLRVAGVGVVVGLVVSAAATHFGVGKLLEPAGELGEVPKAEVDDPRQAKRRGTAYAANTKRSKTGAADEIKTVNMFCPTCVDDGRPKSDDGEVSGEAASRLPLQLLATMESDDPDYSMATIIDTETLALSAYRVNDEIREKVVLESVERGRVIIDNAGKPEYLTIGDEPPPPPKEKKKKADDKKDSKNPYAVDGARESISCADENNCTVKRAFVEKLLSNPALLARQARLVPAIRDGETKGFKFYGIRPGSIPKMLGVKNGDMVTSVNGNDLKSVDQALGLYTKLRSAKHLSVNIERKGKIITKEVDIQ